MQKVMREVTIEGINQISTNARWRRKSERALKSYRKENGFLYYPQEIKKTNRMEKKAKYRLHTPLEINYRYLNQVSLNF